MDDKQLTKRLKKIQKNNQRNTDVEKEFVNLKSEIRAHFQQPMKMLGEYNKKSKTE